MSLHCSQHGAAAATTTSISVISASRRFVAVVCSFIGIIIIGSIATDAVSTTSSSVYGSGYGVYFDGARSNAIIQVESASDSCGVDASAADNSASLSPIEQAMQLDALPARSLIGSRPSRTLMAWARMSPELSLGTDMQILGHPFEKGPRLFISGDTLRYFSIAQPYNQVIDCITHNITHFKGVPLAHPMTFSDRRWHHVGMSYNLTRFELYYDAQIVEQCTFDITDPAKLAQFQLVDNPNSRIHIGCYDDGFGSGNSNSFPGFIDEVRVFSSYFPPNVITSMASRTWLSDSERLSLSLEFTFDDAGTAAPSSAPNLVLDTSGSKNHGYLGGTSSTAQLTLRWPSYVASNSLPTDDPRYPANPSVHQARNPPVLGFRKVIQSRQITVAANPANQYDIAIRFEPLDPDAYANTTFTLVNITRASGSSGRLFAASDLSTPISLSANTNSAFKGIDLVYRPAVGETGRVFAAQVVPGDSLTSSSAFTLEIQLTPNESPISGGGGGSLYCDGVDDYAFNPDFTWPLMNVTMADGSVRTGGVPHTAEFWAFVTKDSELDSALFSVGNAEIYTSWVDGFSPYRKQGRFFARVPFSGGVSDMFMQYQTIGTDITTRYNQWTHFAFAHDQVNGTNSYIYVNGELAAFGTHDHLGVGVDLDPANGNIKDQSLVKTLSLCTWAFWSEVYHRGFVDDFRLWTRVRSQDEIKRDMHRTLTGTEPGLIAYYTFDDIPTYGPPVGGNGDARAIKDMTPHGHDLWMGGCAPCEDYHKGWMPYDDTHGSPTITNVSLQDVGGPGYRVCLPAAKSYDSKYLELAPVFGATSHCFGTIAQSDPQTYPTRFTSTAPVAGHEYAQLASPSTEIIIQLNATDPNSLDELQFRIVALPPYTSIRYTTDGGQTYVSVAANTLLPLFVNQLYLLPQSGYGGVPIGMLQYQVTDGLLTSPTTNVPVYVQCPRGQYIDTSSNRCMNCTAGSYSSVESYETACTLCPRHQFQDQVGQVSCKKCVRSVSFANQLGATACTLCSTLSDDSSSVASTDMLVANDFQCSTPIQRAFFDATASTAAGALFIDVLNQTATLNVFDSSKPVLAYVSSLPQYGKLNQGSAVSPSQTHQIGASLETPFYSVANPIIQYASSAQLLGSFSSRDGHPLSALIGPPDVFRYGTSSGAWSPQKSASASVSTYQILVNFTDAMYVQAVSVFESLNPGAISQIEALNSVTGQWVSLWYILSESSASASTPRNLREFQPKDMCPSLFQSKTLRLTFDPSLTAFPGAFEIDAIGLYGMVNREELGYAWIDGSVIAYSPPSTDQVPLYIGYSDSFSYVVRDCSADSISVKSNVQMGISPQPMPVLQASTKMQRAVYALSAISLALVIASMAVVTMFRNAVIVRSSNYPFCMATLFFHLPLPIGAVFYALQPDSGAYVCHLRPWFTSLAVVGILSALVTKTNQNREIFNNTKLSVTRFSIMKLVSMTAVMIGLELILLIIFSALPLTNPVLSEGSGKGNGFMVWTCSATSGHSVDTGSPSFVSDTSFAIWLAVQFAYVFGFLVTVLYMAFSVRSVPQAFNEASALLNTVFTMAFFLIVLVPLQFVVDGDVDALMLIRGIGQNLACIMFVLALFGPKFYYIAIGRANDKTMQLTQPTIAPSMNDGTGTGSGGGGAVSKLKAPTTMSTMPRGPGPQRGTLGTVGTVNTKAGDSVSEGHLRSKSNTPFPTTAVPSRVNPSSRSTPAPQGATSPRGIRVHLNLSATSPQLVQAFMQDVLNQPNSPDVSMQHTILASPQSSNGTIVQEDNNDAQPAHASQSS